MGFHAQVCKVFIASPSDVSKEREIVRNTLARWNTLNSESMKLVLLPIGWDTSCSPQIGYAPQEYINQTLLENCDILIGIFWSKLGYPTQFAESGSVEEIQRHSEAKKKGMLYFSQKPIPPECLNVEQYQKLQEFKKSIQSSSLYREYSDENNFEKKLFDDIHMLINDSKFGTRFIFSSRKDFDYLGEIKDDDKTFTVSEKNLVYINDLDSSQENVLSAINRLDKLVAKNLVKLLLYQNRSDSVWDAIVEKLKKSPADMRETMIFMAQEHEYRHVVYEKGVEELANISPHDFCIFMGSLMSINANEFRHFTNLLPQTEFAKKLLHQAEELGIYLK